MIIARSRVDLLLILVDVKNNVICIIFVHHIGLNRENLNVLAVFQIADCNILLRERNSCAQIVTDRVFKVVVNALFVGKHEMLGIYYLFSVVIEIAVLVGDKAGVRVRLKIFLV